MSVAAKFSRVCGSAPAPKNKTVLISVRVTEDERAILEQLSGSKPISTYMREALLGPKAVKRRQLRQPQLNETQYAALLAELGKSRMSSNLNQLAHHANMGTLDVSPDIEHQLQEAYSAVLEMRKALFMALGLKCGGQL